jgi:hypothetical protein
MTPRRSFLKKSLVLSAVAAFFPGSSVASDQKEQPGEGPSPIDNLKKEGVQFFLRKGYRDVGELPLITNEPFNGGLRYDEDMGDVREAAFRVQRCARIEDVHGKGKRGVLPHFTLLAASAPLTAKPEFFSEVFEFLITARQLDPKKMTITTTRMAEVYFLLFKRWGILDQQIRHRDIEEAKARGDGSGYFAPRGHPRCPGAPSFSVHYQLVDGEEIELAEMSFPEKTAGESQAVGGIGLERLAMAEGMVAPSWEEALQKMHKHVAGELKERGGDAPEGYKRLANG